jgi:BMFP domain-containing protein YqiC
MLPGNRINANRVAIQAGTRAHHQSSHPAYRPRIIRPPAAIQQAVESLDPATHAVLAEVAQEVASEIDRTLALDDQLAHIEAVWRERFDVIVKPIVESLQAATAEALQALEAQTPDADPRSDVEEPDAGTRVQWGVAGVLLLGAALAGGGLGAELAHGHYASAALWALSLILAAYGWIKE